MGTGKAKMWHNPDFSSKMDKMQSRIEQMAEEYKASKTSPAKKSKKARPQSAYPDDHPLACEKFPEKTPSTLDEFRDLMDWVYGPKPKKHASPTKRLM